MIRETWANRAMFTKMRAVFMMGQSANDKINDLLKIENDLYGDIVQENFIDTYRNLTYKGIMSMKWISEYCSNVKFILKADDDVVINVFTIWNYLKALHRYNMHTNGTIFCHTWKNSNIERSKKSKWYVSEKEMSGTHYRTYCAGAAYILTPDLPQIFYNVSFYVKYFWIDDYYITGILKHLTNTIFKNINSLFRFTSTTTEELYKGKQLDIASIGHFIKNVDKMFYVWFLVLKRQEVHNPDLFSHDKNKNFRKVPQFYWETREP
jgi:beta-1,3-galactosyltransferase 1